MKDPIDGSKPRLEKWYYFWVNHVYTDPMVLIRNGENWWTVHPGQNRWIAASLRPPQEYDVILVTDKPLVKPRGVSGAVAKRIMSGLVPADIVSIRVCGLSDLKPYVSPQPKSEDWLGQPPVTTWNQWYDDYNRLAASIKEKGQGSLALTDGSRTYTMGHGSIISCWKIKPGSDGLEELAKMFAFADGLGWNQL